MRPIHLPLVLILAAAPPAQNLVRDIAPPNVVRDSNITAMVDLHGIAVFRAVTAHGRELWRSDGTGAGTFLLKDIAPGVDSSTPDLLTVAGNYVFFTANVPGLGSELWRTDGTSTGTILLRDHAPRSDSGNPTAMVGYGNHVYYAMNDAATGVELWRSDGTSAGTALWRDLNPGAASSSPAFFRESGTRRHHTLCAVVGGRRQRSVVRVRDAEQRAGCADRQLTPHRRLRPDPRAASRRWRTDYPPADDHHRPGSAARACP